MTYQPRIEKIEQRYSPYGVELSWSNTPSTITGSNSVLLYRSDLGRYGTYSIIGSVLTTGSGTVIAHNYLDMSGSLTSWYKVQFYDGVGSSPFSDPLSVRRINYLCTDKDVRDILRLSANNDELGSNEIEQAIIDSQNEIYSEFGNPLKKTHSYIVSTGSKYWIKENREPVYRIDRVIVAGSEVNVGSYITDLSQGTVLFTSAFVGSEADELVEFEWTPTVFNLLCKNIAARDLLEDWSIKDGDTITNPKIDKIQERIDRYRNNIVNFKGVIRSTSVLNDDERNSEYVYQEFLVDTVD